METLFLGLTAKEIYEIKSQHYDLLNAVKECKRAIENNQFGDEKFILKFSKHINDLIKLCEVDHERLLDKTT